MPQTAQDAIQLDALQQQDQAIENDPAANADLDNGAGDDVLSPRMTEMERIAENRRRAMEAEDGVQFDDESERGEQLGEPRQNDEPDQLAAQLAQDERETAYADPSLRVKVKVEGEEIELPLSEVVKSYQKDAAASRRLTEATRLLEFAEQQANKIQPQSAKPSNNPPADEDQDAPDKEHRREKIKSAASKLYEGDEEGFAEEIEQLLDAGASRATQPSIDPVQIAAHVKQQLAVESAYSEVEKDYPAVFATDERGVVLGREAVQRMNAKEAQGVSRSQALRESVEEVATLFGIQRAGRQSTEPRRTARDEKLERKARLDIPGRANVIAGSEVSPAEATDVSSTIREMAKGRLGQSLNIR